MNENEKEDLKTMLDLLDNVRSDLHYVCQTDTEFGGALLARAYQKLTEGADIIYKLAYDKGD